MRPISSDTWLVYVCFGVILFGTLFIVLGRGEFCDTEGQCIQRVEEFRRLPLNGIGDTLAGVFSPLAFALAFVAIIFQANELRHQRKEMAVTNTGLDKQRFDNLFFELVNTQNLIVESIDIRKSTGGMIIHQGRDCFKYFSKQIGTQSDLANHYGDEDPTLKDFEKLFSEHGSDLAHYFRYSFNTMRVISESEFSEIKHVRLYRSLFSNDELLILFYNCLSTRGRKMIPYTEKFDLFDNLPREALVRSEHWDKFEELKRNLLP